MTSIALIGPLLILYLLTVCPTVYLGDSGELTAAAFCLGVPHNSGYPLYSLVGKLFCLIPIGNIGFRMNLLSAALGVATVVLVYSLILRVTVSRVGALVGSLVLAFTPLFWFQTVSAEVYTLHAFFVALLMRVLWWWEEGKAFYRLVLLVFVTGLSFGNHLQTVMMAPGVLWIVVSGDRRVLLNWKRFMVLGVFLVIPLLVYVYLPIRTEAGAAIHWGDPDSWGRFWAHVSGRSHRGGYVFNLGVWGYVERLKEALLLVWSQFGVLLGIAVWGWVQCGLRWRVFFLGVVGFDLFYTVFLNTISLEITPFNLSVCVVLAIGIGIGVVDLVKRCERVVSGGVLRGVKMGCGVVPGMFLALNFGVSDQSRNYTAYEHAINVFRTAERDSILFMNGDNYVFPVTYVHLVERMREDVNLYDRHSILFKMPGATKGWEARNATWEEKRNEGEKKIIVENPHRTIYYAIFGPYTIDLPASREMIPEGVMHRVFRMGDEIRPDPVNTIWKYYSTESFYETFGRDFMNREICAHFFFCLGRHLILAGQKSAGLRNLGVAAEVGYDAPVIHTEMGIFLIDHGFLDQARQALEKALIYHEDLGDVYNTWGYFYAKSGDHVKAVDSFRKAVKLRPDRYGFYKNLGFALFEAGDKQASEAALRRSLAIKAEQPEIVEFINEKLGS